MRIGPARRIFGRLTLPGDKSISHRAALIAALARGTSRLSNFATGRDCASTLSCVEQLGATVKRSGSEITIQAPAELHAPKQPLDCGNSGSTMRMIAGVLAGQDFACELMGDESLSLRPMKRIIEPLQQMGATINATDGKPPLKIRGTRSLRAITYQLPIASAQVKSCILFAGLGAAGETKVIEMFATRDHTERLFNGFGVPVTNTPQDDGTTAIVLNGPARFENGDLKVPGDVSSAAYFIAAAMLLPNSDLTIQAVSLNPTRTEYLTVFRDWGARITTTDIETERNEPLGTIEIQGSENLDGPQKLSGAIIPSLIDELPLMAVIGTQLDGGLEIRSAAELRVKEADRIKATIQNLRAMGAEVEEYEDGLFVNGPATLHGAEINSFGDHRIAMAFSIAALIAHGPSEISGSSCVDISFPEFFKLLDQIAET